MVQTDVLQELNPAQRDAVEAIEGPVLVVAGPGSGKTRVLTYRVAYLVKVCSVEPWRIMAVTFTNKAAREMRGRLDSLVGDELRRLTVGTFHAFCLDFLRRRAKTLGRNDTMVVLDETDRLSLVAEALQRLDPKSEAGRHRPETVLRVIERAKQNLCGPRDDLSSWAVTENTGVIAEAYQRYRSRFQRAYR